MTPKGVCVHCCCVVSRLRFVRSQTTPPRASCHQDTPSPAAGHPRTARSVFGTPRPTHHPTDAAPRLRSTTPPGNAPSPHQLRNVHSGQKTTPITRGGNQLCPRDLSPELAVESSRDALHHAGLPSGNRCWFSHPQRHAFYRSFTVGVNPVSRRVSRDCRPNFSRRAAESAA